MTVRMGGAACLLILAICMVVQNVTVSRVNEELQAQLQAELRRQTLLNTPRSGWRMAPLKGHDINGLPVQTTFDLGDRLVLLFSSTCSICEENWTRWDELLTNKAMSSSVLFVSVEKSLPTSYIDQHRIRQRAVLLGLDPEIARSMRLRITPQTLVVKAGKVTHSWAGRLSREDLQDIATVFSSHDNAP